MNKLLDVVALSSGMSLVAPFGGGLVLPPVRVQYTAIARSQTPLPEGFRPPSLLADSTGSLLLGDDLFHRRDEIERTALGSHEFVQKVAVAVPLDEDDERLVGAAVAQTLSTLTTRPLRRRAGSTG